MNWCLYRCPHCKKIVKRYWLNKDGTPKKWIRSWCEEKGIDVRIQLVEGEMMEWQPIETVPKDRPILIREKKGFLALFGDILCKCFA